MTKRINESAIPIGRLLKSWEKSAVFTSELVINFTSKRSLVPLPLLRLLTFSFNRTQFQVQNMVLIHNGFQSHYQFQREDGPSHAQ